MNSAPPFPAASAHRGRGRLSALLALNAALAALALAGLYAPRAWAQSPPRARGNYLMVSGHASGVSGNVIYIVDSVNQELVALRYLRAPGRLEPLGYRNLASDSAQGAQSR